VLAWVLQACCSNGRFPSDVRAGALIKHDERLDTWRVNGEKVCAPTMITADGCYVLEAKYKADYFNLRGPSTPFVPGFELISGVVAVGDAAAKSHSAHYESDLAPFALWVRSQYSYYVTATFDGDQFMPRIVELDANQQRIREILPARSLQELEQCHPGITPLLAGKSQ
jgi:hypothetical protein